MVPMYWPPIWVGSVWVNLIRSGDMMVMKAMSVCRADGFGDRLQNLSGPAGFDGFCRRGRVGDRGGDADDLLACRLVGVAPGIEQCQRAACQYHHCDHEDLQCDGLTGQGAGPPGGSSAQFLSGDGEYVVSLADGDEVPGAVDGMPDRTGHRVGDGLVDGIRNQLVVQSLPHVDRSLDLCDVESPLPIEQFSVADQSVGAVGEAFGARVAEFALRRRVEAGSVGRNR